jgi:4-aminobutyrate---pyruvate transaminase
MQRKSFLLAAASAGVLALTGMAAHAQTAAWPAKPVKIVVPFPAGGAYGVLTRALGDNVNVCPPLIIEPAQIDQLFDGIRAALDDTLTWVQRTGLRAQ